MYYCTIIDYNYYCFDLWGEKCSVISTFWVYSFYITQNIRNIMHQCWIILFNAFCKGDSCYLEHKYSFRTCEKKSYCAYCDTLLYSTVVKKSTITISFKLHLDTRNKNLILILLELIDIISVCKLFSHF